MRRIEFERGLATLVLVCGMAVAAQAQPTVRVSVGETGGQATGGGYSARPAISANGAVVAFESPLASLVSGDTNNATDVFIYAGGALTRVTASGGVQLDCSAQRPALSSDGQLVVFDSCATNAIAGDTNGSNDVFVLDRGTGDITRASNTVAGLQPNQGSFAAAISPNGRYVAYISTASNIVGGVSGTHVYRYDRNTSTTVLISRANGGGAAGDGPASGRPSVSDAGLVAFTSDATNLVAGDTNATADVFVGDGATTQRVSVSAAGGQLAAPSSSPSISRDGRLVAFTTAAQAAAGDANPVNDVYVRDRTANATVLVSRTPGGQAGNGSSFEPVISANGAFVSFSSVATDLNGPFDPLVDVFRAGLNVGGGTVAVTSVVRFSVGTGMTSGNSTEAWIADDGRVVFASNEPTLTPDDTNGDTDVFLATAPGTNARLSLTGAGLQPTYSGSSTRPSPSFTGATVAFLSSATSLVPNDTNGTVDVFVRDVATGKTTRLPVPPGYQGVHADWVTISHDGRWVAYNRTVSFLHDRSTGATIPVSVPAAGGAPVPAASPVVSASGRYVAFVTAAALSPVDTNGLGDVYVFDRITGTTTLASITSAGGAGNGNSLSPGISGNGRYVVFQSAASNMHPGDTDTATDIFVRDLVAGTTTWVSNVPPLANFEARDPAISDDGEYIVFLYLSTTSTAEGDVPSRVYTVRRDTPAALRGSLSAPTEGGVLGDDSAYDPTLSTFGRFLSFRSYKPNLIGGDTNAAADVFGRQILDGAGAPTFGPIVLITAGSGGGVGSGGGSFGTENPEIGGNAEAIAYQSAFTNLVAGDTNGMVDAFLRQNVFDARECDFYDPAYTTWLQGFGVDPCSDAGSPFADPDGDGYTNDEERTGVGGDGHPTLGVFTRYFAEGATKTSGLNFDVRIALANPNPFTVTGELSYQMPSGAAVPVTPFSLAAYERTTIVLDQQPGIDEGGPDVAYEFATTVKATAAIGADRLMTWDKNVYAGHAEVGVVSPARVWYFAEGATIAGFQLFYLLQNPNSEPVTVQGTYLLGTGQTFTKSYQLPPNSRTNVWANVEQIGGGMPLASAEFSAVFQVTAGPAIIAERAMYQGQSPLFNAGHESAGITEPATEWFLAEGNAGEFFDNFVLIGNPTQNAALVEADFIVGDPATIYTKRYVVNPLSRFNIWVDLEELAPGVFPFQQGNTDVSIRLRSLNLVPLIVERAMWWAGDPGAWYEAHNSPAAARTAPRWVLGEGEAGGPLNWQTYILVANTGATGGPISLRLLVPGGGDYVVHRTMDPQSRKTFPLPELLADAGLPPDTPAGVLVESTGAPLQLVVERAMYRNANGQTFIVGTNALGTPLP